MTFGDIPVLVPSTVSGLPESTPITFSGPPVVKLGVLAEELEAKRGLALPNIPPLLPCHEGTAVTFHSLLSEASPTVVNKLPLLSAACLAVDKCRELGPRISTSVGEPEHLKIFY